MVGGQQMIGEAAGHYLFWLAAAAGGRWRQFKWNPGRAYGKRISSFVAYARTHARTRIHRQHASS